MIPPELLPVIASVNRTAYSVSSEVTEKQKDQAAVGTWTAFKAEALKDSNDLGETLQPKALC